MDNMTKENDMKSALIMANGTQYQIYYKDDPIEVANDWGGGILIDVDQSMANQKEWLKETEQLRKSIIILQAKQEMKAKQDAYAQLQAEGLLQKPESPLTVARMR